MNLETVLRYIAPIIPAIIALLCLKSELEEKDKTVQAVRSVEFCLWIIIAILEFAVFC